MLTDDFLFDGQSLSSYGYICSGDGLNDQTSNVSSMTYNTIKSPISNISHKTSTTYDENLSRVIQISKNPCGNNDLNLTQDDISEITKWLCRKEYKWFQWIYPNDSNDVMYEVKFNVSNVELGENIIGLELTIDTNRPYGVTPVVRKTFDFSSNLTDYINVHSDEEGEIYPNMNIKILEDGDFKLKNEYEDRTMTVKNCKQGETITIYGNDLLQFESSNLNHSSDDFNYNFFRLCNQFNKYKNVISSNLKCKIDIEYRGIRKVGL